MIDKAFVDSNIWLYAFMGDDGGKRQKALSLLTTNNVILSTQVINEVCRNLIRKANYTETEIQQTIQNFELRYTIVKISLDDTLYASSLRERFSLSYWDSLIVAVAVRNNCNTLYSEDMQHGQKIEKTTIINPF